MDNTNHNTPSSTENQTASETTRQSEPTGIRKVFIAPDVSAPITVGSLTLAASTSEAGGFFDGGIGGDGGLD